MNRYLVLAFFLGFLCSYLWVMAPAEATRDVAQARECPQNTKLFGFVVPSHGPTSVICNYGSGVQEN